VTAGFEFWLSIVGSLVVGLISGSFAAERRFEGRVMKLEHEMWGTQNNNGMKRRVERLDDRIDRALTQEARDVRRLDSRNRRQHPEDYGNEYKHEGEE
jgi:hypothetical protein